MKLFCLTNISHRLIKFSKHKQNVINQEFHVFIKSFNSCNLILKQTWQLNTINCKLQGSKPWLNSIQFAVFLIFLHIKEKEVKFSSYTESLIDHLSADLLENRKAFYIQCFSTEKENCHQTGLAIMSRTWKATYLSKAKRWKALSNKESSPRLPIHMILASKAVK